MFLHPVDHVTFDGGDLRNAITQNGGAEHGHVRAGQQHFQGVARAVDAAGGGETGVEPAM